MIFVSPFYNVERRNPTMQSLQMKSILTILKNGIDYSDINDRVVKSLGLLPYKDLVMLKYKKSIFKLICHPDKGLKLSAQLGLIDSLKFFISFGASDFDNAMKKAASRGYIDIVNQMIEYGASDFDKALTSAARKGHTSIVKILIHGAINLDDACMEAASEGHDNIANLMLDHGASSLSFWYGYYLNIDRMTG
jgi:hypothetical protein